VVIQEEEVNMKTKQELFDAVVDGFCAQGWRRSIDENGACVYRGPNGTKCAIGILIPNDVYSVRMEGKPLSGLLALAHANGIELPGEITEHQNFLAALQTVHDSCVMNPDDGLGLKLAINAFGLGAELKLDHFHARTL
jgi:hypothetical protein